MRKISSLILALAASLCFLSCKPQISYSEPPKQFTVTYVTDHGTAPAQKTVNEGTVLAASDLPSLESDFYDFAGWFFNETKITSGYAVKENVTLTAKWTPAYYGIWKSADNKSRVQLKKDGTFVLAQVDYEYDGTPSVLYLKGTFVAQSNVFTFKCNLFSMDFEQWLDPAEYGVPETMTNSYTLSETKLVITQDGVSYEYVRTNLSSIFYNDSDIPSADIVTVTYSSDYGEEPLPVNVPANSSLTEDFLSELSADDYDFDGWYIGETKVTAGYEVTEDITLTAKWTYNPVKYSVTYTSEKGTVPSSIDVVHNSTLIASQLPVLSTTGYNFDGWYIGETKVTAGYEVTGDITLTAMWKPLVEIPEHNENLLPSQSASVNDIFAGNTFEYADTRRNDVYRWEFGSDKTVKLLKADYKNGDTSDIDYPEMSVYKYSLSDDGKTIYLQLYKKVLELKKKEYTFFTFEEYMNYMRRYTDYEETKKELVENETYRSMVLYEMCNTYKDSLSEELSEEEIIEAVEAYKNTITDDDIVQGYLVMQLGDPDITWEKYMNAFGVPSVKQGILMFATVHQYRIKVTEAETGTVYEFIPEVHSSTTEEKLLIACPEIDLTDHSDAAEAYFIKQPYFAHCQRGEELEHNQETSIIKIENGSLYILGSSLDLEEIPYTLTKDAETGLYRMSITYNGITTETVQTYTERLYIKK